MKYVERCENCEWAIEMWRRDKPGETWLVPFMCRSWRHEGECRLWKGAQDFVRVKEALESVGDWSYLVLTYPQNDWPDKDELYRACVLHWSKLRKRLTRYYGKFKYIQTWERHLNGGPHVNIVISSPSLAIHLDDIGYSEWLKFWVPRLMECGYGYIDYVDRLRDKGAINSYLNKAALELTGAGVKSQIPYDAPPHFRRLRATAKFLPPVHKNPDIAGVLRFVDESGQVLRAHPVPQEVQNRADERENISQAKESKVFA